MHQNDLNKQREPAIWFRRQLGGKPSMNKVGGRPTLPSGIEWPRQSQVNTPLHFLAQIDLSTLPPAPLHDAPNAPILPRRGTLFFFADMVEEMLWGDNGGAFANTRVIIANEAGPERIPPQDTPEIFHSFGERAGGYKTGIIEYPPMTLEPHVIDTFGGIVPFPHPSDTYAQAAEAAMVASIEKAIGAPIPVFKNATHREVFEAGNPREYILEYHMQDGTTRQELNCPRHQMLGNGRNIQGTAEDEHADGSILLLQIDSDEDRVHKEFMFCDAGAAQFWIEPADLAQGRVDRAWATTEGG
jgi:uncharacterized protein YwqG